MYTVMKKQVHQKATAKGGRWHMLACGSSQVPQIARTSPFLSLSESPGIGSFWTSKSSLKTTITPARIQDSVTKNHSWKNGVTVGPKQITYGTPDPMVVALRHLQKLGTCSGLKVFYRLESWRVFTGARFVGQLLRTPIFVIFWQNINSHHFHWRFLTCWAGPWAHVVFGSKKTPGKPTDSPYGFQPTFGG